MESNQREEIHRVFRREGPKMAKRKNIGKKRSSESSSLGELDPYLSNEKRSVSGDDQLMDVEVSTVFEFSIFRIGGCVMT